MCEVKCGATVVGITVAGAKGDLMKLNRGWLSACQPIRNRQGSSASKEEVCGFNIHRRMYPKTRFAIMISEPRSGEHSLLKLQMR